MVSFPRGTEMFQFPRLPPPGLCVQPGVTTHHRRRVAPFGNPGISLLDGSPWLIAVIPRPSSARSAKASTVRRSHLTCATPFAGAVCNRLPQPRCSSAGSHVQNHTRASHRPAQPGGRKRRRPRPGLRETSPAAPQQTVAAVARGAVDASLHLSLVKAHPEVGRPASAGTADPGVQEAILATRERGCQQGVYRGGARFGGNRLP